MHNHIITGVTCLRWMSPYKSSSFVLKNVDVKMTYSSDDDFWRLLLLIH